jgi:hypothetical protein
MVVNDGLGIILRNINEVDISKHKSFCLANAPTNWSASRRLAFAVRQKCFIFQKASRVWGNAPRFSPTVFKENKYVDLDKERETE